MNLKTGLVLVTIIAIIVALAIIRFLVHELVRFIEISAVAVIIILALAWLLGRRTASPTAGRP